MRDLDVMLPNRYATTTELAHQNGFFDLAEPLLRDFGGISSYATVLSRLCRFGGKGTRFYSVAEHTIYCDRLMQYLGHTDLEERRAVFAHDLHEAVMGVDLVTPLKRCPDLGGWNRLERRCQEAVYDFFRVEESPAITRAIDHLAYATEKAELFPDHGKWHRGELPPSDLPIPALSMPGAAEVMTDIGLELGFW